MISVSCMHHTPSTFRRILAHYIDGAMALIIFTPLLIQCLLNWLADGSLHFSVLFFGLTYGGYLFFLILSYTFFSASVGKCLMGLRLVSAHGGEIHVQQSLLRVLADQLSLFFGWGLFALALIRFDRRHFSDLMAETKVVQVREDDGFPRRYVLLGLGLCLFISAINWSSVQERWSHVELRNKQIYFETQ